MKRFNSILLGLTVGCACAISLHATDTIYAYDTWADGNRTSGTPGGGGDTPWYASTGTALSGSMVATLPTGSLTFLTYFAADGSPITLAPGGEIKVTWTFTPFGVNANNTSQNFALGVVDTPTAALASADNFTTASAVYSGYSMYSNMGRTLGNGNPWLLKKWSGITSDFLGHQGNWTPLVNGATSGQTGYTPGVSYTYVFDAVRDASTGNLIINSTMTGTGLNGVGFMTTTYTDTTPAGYTFDTFCVRPAGSASTASSLNTTFFEAEYIVPEPSTFMLAGLGLLGLVGLRRARR